MLQLFIVILLGAFLHIHAFLPKSVILNAMHYFILRSLMDLTLYTLSRSASLWSALGSFTWNQNTIILPNVSPGTWFFPLTIFPH